MFKFAGIGSRETPNDIIDIMINIGEKLSERGWLLRSGAADGADSAFEKKFSGPKEIFLPWKNFNNHKSDLYNISDEAYSLARSIHPSWYHLSDAAKKLHARNCYQVLGITLDDPVDIVICWTPEGKNSGGTRTAIVLANKNKIPVVNLFNTREVKDLILKIEKKLY